MRHRLTFALAALISAVAPTGPAMAEIELVRAGIVCPDGRNGPLRDAPDTVLGGVREIADLAVDVETRDVPLIPGLGLGIETRWQGDGPHFVRMLTLHPPMGSTGTTRQSYGKTLIPGDVSVRAYTFEFAYELVPGVWSLQVTDETGLLLSVDFTVSDAPNAAVTEGCGLSLNS